MITFDGATGILFLLVLGPFLAIVVIGLIRLGPRSRRWAIGMLASLLLWQFLPHWAFWSLAVLSLAAVVALGWYSWRALRREHQ